jgi:hypothetical protein
MLALCAALVALVASIAFAPAWLMRRAQDRLAARLLAGESADSYRLLTRAALVVGPRRRLPGVLGLTADTLLFHGLFGERITLSTDRIQKIVTGNRLPGGRPLGGSEALSITPSSGERIAFTLTRAAARAWRSHLGLWAVQERASSMDLVKPGRGN